VHVSQYTYDWRRSLFEALDGFISHLEKISKLTGGKPVQIIAHSMGGLVTMGVLNRRPDLVHSVLFCGVPFTPGIGFLSDLHVGDVVGANKKILAPSVLSTFTSLWVFFPDKNLYQNKEKIDDISRIVDADWKTLEIDFYSLADWKKYALGIFSFSETENANIPPGLEDHLKNALADALKYRQEMIVFKSDVKYPPVGVLNSDSFDTLSYIVKSNNGGVRGYDFEAAKKDPGDCRVRPADSLPPTGLNPVKIWNSKKAHAHLLSDLDVPNMLIHLAKSV